MGLLETLDVAPSRAVTPLMFEHDLVERARAADRAHRAPGGHDRAHPAWRPTRCSPRHRPAHPARRPEEIRAEPPARASSGSTSTEPPSSTRRRDAARRTSPASTRGCARNKGVDRRAGLATSVVDLSYFGTHDGARWGWPTAWCPGRSHHRAHHPPGARGHQDRAGRLRRVVACSSCARRPGARLRRLRRQPRPHRRSSSPTSRSRRRPRPCSSASSRASRCCRTRRASPAPAPTSTRSAPRPPWCASARPELARRGTDPVRRGRRRRGRARRSCPDSAVAGHATVFIFPDLNTGNNTYKAVQRSRRRGRDRTGAAGPAQAGQRPVARRPRATTSSTRSPSPRSRRQTVTRQRARASSAATAHASSSSSSSTPARPRSSTS